MIIEILKPYGKWQKGDTPDVTRSYGMSLVDAKIAKIHEDQTRRDYTPKVEEERQTMTVNNYYVMADNEVLQLEDDEQAAYINAEPKIEAKPKKRNFFNFKK